MKIVEIDNYRDFVALEESWNEVLRRCDHNVFSTWEWQSIWWKHFGSAKKLELLIAEDNDKIVGIAPLMYSVHKMFGLRMGKLEFIGTPYSDYNDFIITDKDKECIKLFIDHMNNLPKKWTCIDLTDIPQNAKCLRILRSVSNMLKVIHKCPYATLPKPPNTFLTSLSSKLRKDLRRNLRHLENRFKVEFADYSDPQSFVEGMNIFFELHKRRWESKGLSGAITDQQVRSFHLDIAKSFSQKKRLGLFSLVVSNEPVAILYGFKYRSRFYFYLSGFDPKYSRYSVGNLLIAHVIDKCVHEGLVEFDFLRGAELYKDRWNTKTRYNLQAIIPRKGFLSSFQNWLYMEYWHQGNRIKYILKIK